MSNHIESLASLQKFQFEAATASQQFTTEPEVQILEAYIKGKTNPNAFHEFTLRGVKVQVFCGRLHTSDPHDEFAFGTSSVTKQNNLSSIIDECTKASKKVRELAPTLLLEFDARLNQLLASDVIHQLLLKDSPEAYIKNVADISSLIMSRSNM